MNYLKINKSFINVFFLLITVFICTAVFGINKLQNDEAHEAHEGGVELTDRQIELADIVVHEIHLQQLPEQITAPGEIVQNSYKTTSVTPRVSAQVVERHTRLGDDVKVGQPLVTLSSVEMAMAQGDLLVLAREWKRVRSLGRTVVSEKRYTQAQVKYQQAKSRVLTYGMTLKQSEDFIKNGDVSKVNGQFQLLAMQSGTVLSDQFTVGELIEPGEKLFTISDESVLWVEAKLTHIDAQLVKLGSLVSVISDGRKYAGIVVQAHHALDEGTRTLGVRIEVSNPGHLLHPGMFVQVKISSCNSSQVLAVPVNAVLRSPDGDWVVFVEHEANEFEPVEVELLRTTRGLAIIEGVKPHTRIVTQGAFFVQSELAKAGFEVHNH